MPTAPSRILTWSGVYAGVAGLIGLGASIYADFRGVTLSPFTRDLIQDLLVPLGIAGVGTSAATKVIAAIRTRADDPPRELPAELSESQK